MRDALLAELDGRNELRNARLAEALRAAPDYEPARWHDGQVRLGTRWLRVEEAQKQFAKDQRLEQYSLRRMLYLGKPSDQLALANWCRSKGLIEEERVHLMKVLELDPRHAEAQRRLNVRWVDGQWQTPEEVARLEKLRQAARSAWHRWRPVVTRWREALEGKNEAAREEVLEKLRQVRDPEALPALERLLSPRGEELALEVVAVLGKVEHTQATDSLLRHAVLSPWEAAQEAAIAHLQARPKHDFLPRLLAGMEAPIEDSYTMTRDDLGRTYFGISLFRETQDAEYAFDRSLTIGRYVILTYIGTVPNRLPVISSGEVGATNAEKSRMRLAATNIRTKVAAHNERAEALNRRIAKVLSATTGQEYTEDPKVWWEWWTQWNESYAPEKPRYYDYYDHVLSYRVNGPIIPMMSCFSADTLVWTHTGLTPIHAIQPGDRILAQHQDTGEMTFQSVIATTVRPETPLIKIGAGGESLSATRGHPFWVAGKGWRMAKNLKPGDLLHGLRGAVRVEALEEAKTQKAYNLVVDGYNTFFVGQQALLVHDNVLRAPTDCVLPGLSKEDISRKAAGAASR